MKRIITYLIEKLQLKSDSEFTERDPRDPSTWMVGDILCGTWGYSMRIPAWFKIVKRTTSQFVVQQMKGKIISGHRNGQWEEMPDEDAPLGKEFKARIRKGGSVVVDSCYVRLWTGQSLYGDDMD